LRDIGRFFLGGNVLPPNINTETDVDIRCPDDKSEKIKAAICRVLPVDQFGRETLLFHGTCDPNAVPFPNATDHDNLRWYAFEPNMSLDFIKEEADVRARNGLNIGLPTLFVYRMKRPIRNILLYADSEQWEYMGGQGHLLRRKICNIKVDLRTTEGFIDLDEVKDTILDLEFGEWNINDAFSVLSTYNIQLVAKKTSFSKTGLCFHKKNTSHDETLGKCA